MKNNITMILLAVLAVLSATAVSAQLTLSDVTFGDESQERNENVSRTFTVTNLGTAPVTFDTITFSGVSGVDVTQYKLLITGVTAGTGVVSTLAVAANGVLSGSATLDPNETLTFNVQAFVTKSFNAVDASVVVTPLQIATVSALSGTTSVTTTAGKVSMQAKNKLVVDDMTVVVNSESQSVSNNERVDNLKPGDKLEFEVIIKNQFSDRSDVDFDIDDVTVSVKSNNLDEVDLDEEDDLGTLSAKGDDSSKFSFNIQDDTNDATYTLTVKVIGTDQNGAKHGEVQTVRLKVERATHEIGFKRTEIVPPTVECDGSRTVTVDATVNNIGKRNEDEVVVEAAVPQLKFDKKVTGLKLDKGKSKTVQFPIDVPEDVKPGTYHVDLTTFFENTIKSNMKSVNFVVSECEVEVVEEPEVVTEPPAPVTPPAAPTPQPTTPPAPRVSVSQKSFSDSTLYVYVLAGASAFLLFLLMVTLIVLVSRRRHNDD